MRVAYVCADPGVPVFGCKGCSIHVQEVVRALQHLGARVDLFATRFGADPPSDLRSLHCHLLPELPRGATDLREVAALDANHGLSSALLRHGPFDLVYERYSLWSYAGMESAAAIDVAGLLEVNAPLIEEQARHRGLHDRRAAESVARRVFAAATRLIAVSHGVGSYLQELTPTSSKITVIPNGVDVRRFSPQRAPKLPREPGVITIGFVGTLKPWHGVDDLVDAFAQLTGRGIRARLLIVGDGPVGPELRRQVHLAGLDSVVQFIGAVTPIEMPGWLTTMDIAVAPYPERTDFYFSPLKVFEYMAAGRAIVASRIGQLTEVLTDFESARFCRPGDAKHLAETLAQLCGDRKQRLSLGQTARRLAERRHSWNSVAQQIVALANSSRPQLAGT